MAVHQPDEPGRLHAGRWPRIEVDLSPVKEGQAITVLWRGKPVFVRHRTKEEITKALDVKIADLTDPSARNDDLPEKTPATDPNRTKKGHENWMVLVGICTHLGCIPKGQSIGDAGATSAAGSAPATARTTIPQGASVRGRRRAISRCRPTTSCPTAKSRSAEGFSKMASHESTYQPSTRFEKWLDARLPVHAHDACAVRRLPDAAQHQLPVDRRRRC